VNDKLQKYALIAEIIGGIAIVASLVFVGVGIRQSADETALNTRAVEINGYVDLIAQISTLNTLLVDNPEFAERNLAILQGGSLESSSESAQLRAFMMLAFRHGELAFKLYQEQLIDEEELISFLSRIRNYRNTEIGSNHWDFGSAFLNPEYVAYINDMGLICGEYTGTGNLCN
jgi:hypothetical protein